MTRRITLMAVCIIVAVFATMGCGPKTKPTLIKADAAVYEATKAIHDTAVVLGNAGVLTPAQELQIQLKLKPIVALGAQTTRVIQAWTSGPTPPELRNLITQLGALVQEIGKVVPDSPGKAQLLEKVALCQQAVLTVLTIMGGF